VAFLMANQARVGAGSLVLDPFCGSASTLLSCARFGAATVGVDISEAELGGVAHNFEQLGLPPPELLLTADAAGLVDGTVLGAPPGSRYASFDAVVTDPPYGIMEGLGALYVPLPQRVRLVLQIAAARLRVGGRLVFLLPVPAEATRPPLPDLDCLRLEGTSRQPISLRMHRLLVTMVKVRPPSTRDLGAACAEDHTLAGSPQPAALAGDPAAVAPWQHPSWLQHDGFKESL
jgi:tRNA G10  N-methylase Trm11